MNPIAPDIAPEAAEFWEATKDRRLVIQHCPTCGHQWYPRAICTGCGDQPGWVEISGRGTLHSFTTVHRSPDGRKVESLERSPRSRGDGPRSAEPSGRGAGDWLQPPYVIALVELDEGPRMLTRLVGGDPVCDASVIVDWHPLDDGRHLPVFRIEG